MTTTAKVSQMLSVPLNRVRSSKLKRQASVVEDEGGGGGADGELAIDHPSRTTITKKRISSDHESGGSSRSLSPYLRVILDGESTSSYLDVPETSNNSRRSSNNSVVRFKQNDLYDLRSILDMTYEGENLEKAIINNDKYTVRRIIDIHQSKFNVVKDRHSSLQGYVGCGGIPASHPHQWGGASLAYKRQSGTPSLTSNTDIMEGGSKEAFLETNSLSKNNNNSVTTNECCLTPDFSCYASTSHSALTQRSGPLAAALMAHTSSTPAPINFSATDSSGNCELETAAITGAPDSPGDIPPIFRNILHVAIMYDARDVMRISLKYGIDSNAPGVHPLMTDTITNQTNPSNSGRISPDNLPRASPCRNGTLDYNSYYTNERLYMLPPLFLAAQRNNHYATNLLLRYGANPNIRDELACSPLHLAARLQHDVCNILISHHACISTRNKYGDSPLSLWPVVYNLQVAFVEREFRKLCRKYSSSKRHRFLSSSSGNKDETHLTPVILSRNLSNEKCTNGGVKNLKRIFRHSGSDSYDSKSFKKSLSSQSSIGKSKRAGGQHVAISASVGRSESRQMSEEREEFLTTDMPKSSHSKRKIATSLAANIMNYHKSSRNCQSAEANALNERLLKRFSELSRLANNIECIDQLMDLLRMQNCMDEILQLISQATSPTVHARIAELLYTLQNTSYQEFLRNHDKRDYVEKFQQHTKKLLDISLELFASDLPNMQYLALLTINRLYDVYVYHNLINPGRYNACYIPQSRRTLFMSSTQMNNHDDTSKSDTNRLPKTSTLSNILRKISRDTDEKRSATTVGKGQTPSPSGPGPGGGGSSKELTRDMSSNSSTSKRWVPLYNKQTSTNTNDDYFSPKTSMTSELGSSASGNVGINSTPQQTSKPNIFNNSNSNIENTTYTYEPFSVLYQIEPIHLLRIMRTRLEAHRKEFNNRPKCVPSTRSPLCTHHCVVILAARILTILCQDQTFQTKFISSKDNLNIIIEMLNINNDPHLICLILQTLGVVALNPDCHDSLQTADIPDTVLHLILPADEMFYTNQTTKFARYVKHLGARVLVYMGLLTKVSNKVNLFDILELEPEPLDCDKPQSFENNFIHHMAIGENCVGTLWTSFAGISIEKLLDELLKNATNQKSSRLQTSTSQDTNIPTTSTTSSIINSSNENLLYNLSYLSAVIHPVIILRLLEHRLFTPLFKKKSTAASTKPETPTDSKMQFNIVTTPIQLTGASALASIPTLPRPVASFKKQRPSVTKDPPSGGNDRVSLLNKLTQPTSDKRKVLKMNNSKNIPPVNSSSSTIPSTTALATLPLSPAVGTITTANNDLLLIEERRDVIKPIKFDFSRKWFWRNSDRSNQLLTANTSDRNPLLQSIVENDTSTSSSHPLGKDMKLLEKELLNLPTFQLSDSQNPLLPSPICLSYDFATHFENDSISPGNFSDVVLTKQQNKRLPATIPNGIITYGNRIIDEVTLPSSHQDVNYLNPPTTTLNVPFVEVRTPSDDSNRSSFNGGSSRNSNGSVDINNHSQRSSSKMSVRETVKNIFRSSKTVDNIQQTNNNSPHTHESEIFSMPSKSSLNNGQSSHLAKSLSQPITIFDDQSKLTDSPLINHSEHTPLIVRKSTCKLETVPKNSQKSSFETNLKRFRLNRTGLRLPLNSDSLHRSHSCTVGIINTQKQQQQQQQQNKQTLLIDSDNTNKQHGTNIIIKSLASLFEQTPITTTTCDNINGYLNTGEICSLRSSDSTTSSISGYLSPRPRKGEGGGGITCLNELIGGINNTNDHKSSESLFSFSSPTHKENLSKSFIITSTKNDTTKQGNEVLYLIASWVLRSPEDFQDYLVQKELRSFFALLESLRDSFRSWTDQIKELVPLYVEDIESPSCSEIDVSNESIYREYAKMQRDIVSGRLICSKEEAAALAALQLRLETWPDENLELSDDDELHTHVNTLSLSLNSPSSLTTTTATLGGGVLAPWRNRHRRGLLKLRLTNIPCCKRTDSQNSQNRSKLPFLPPEYVDSTEIMKLIKDKQRKLFHINDYDNPTRLKECYVRLCRNLAAYNAEIYDVKETLGKRSKRKANRILTIRPDKVCLLDIKTKILQKEQRIADLEHWITSGHHQNAGTNELVLEYRNKTKWKLQLASTTDLRAITVYLWKIVNIEGFALLDIPINIPMRYQKKQLQQQQQQQQQSGSRKMTLLPPNIKSNKNPYQQIKDYYRTSSSNSLFSTTKKTSTRPTTTEHLKNLTNLMTTTNSTTISGLVTNSVFLTSDNTQQLCFSADLEELKDLFDFPEEVALRLTEIEHEIFLSVPPLQYLRHLTLDISLLPSTTQESSTQEKNIRILVQRFHAVGSFIQQLIVSQTSFHERKAIVASIVRCAITCWYLGNFNGAMEILAGLKIEAFRPLWLTITDEVPSFKFLTEAFNSNEKTSQYCDAVSRALDIPTCKVVPFFGTFLKDLRSILSSVPSIVVLCNKNTQKPIESVADFQNQEHFLTRIGVGGLINTRKIELVHMVLKDIAMFHNRHRRQPLFKCCNDNNRMKSMFQGVPTDLKEKHSATITTTEGLAENRIQQQQQQYRYNRHQSFPCTNNYGDIDHNCVPNIAIKVISDNDNNNQVNQANAALPYRTTLDLYEPETLYCLNVSFYQPIMTQKHNHDVSLLSLHHIIDFNNLQILRHGTTLILYDEESMHSCLVSVRLELDNCTLTWTKPSWDRHHSVENINAQNPITNDRTHFSLLMKRYILRDIACVDMEESYPSSGFLQLKYVKHIRCGILNCDLVSVIKRHKLNDITNQENCFTIIYGSTINENKSLCFISPKHCSQIWYSSIEKLLFQYRYHRLCSDRRIQWLKVQYLSLYYENERFQGPTPMEAVLVFGGRQWNSSSLFSFERGDHPGVTKKMSTIKSLSNLGLRKRNNKNEQLIKTSFSTESDPTTTAAWQNNNSLTTRNKSKTLDYKTKPSILAVGCKQRTQQYYHPSSPKHRHSKITNSINALTTSVGGKRMGGRMTLTNQLGNDSYTSPWIINETYMDFAEFVELFKSFYFHCRRDLKDLFDKFSCYLNIDQDFTIKEQYKNDLIDVPRHLSGLITRNIVDDITDQSIHRIYDMIAISSIPCYAVSTDSKANYLITKEQFKEFLFEHQKETKTNYELEQIILRHEPNRQNRINKVFSFEGFAKYLMDKENYAFVNEHTKVNEQEMDNPLSYYFIASSHNTYLTGHQLRGESSIEMYREVLLSGCRCVELDCWDGEDGSPVIYHGRTFVSKISFKRVVEVINESAFVTSHYPVILSIENRCSLIQQGRMAQIFLSIFGDKLVTKYMFDTDLFEDPMLPSPNQLKHKILIKNKKVNKMHSTTQLSKQKLQLAVGPYRNSSGPDDIDIDDEDEDEDEEYQDEMFEIMRSNSMTDSPMYGLKKDNDGSELDELRYNRRYSILTSSDPAARQRLKSNSSIDNQKKAIIKTLVAKELSDIVIYTQAVKFRGLNYSSNTNSVYIVKTAVRKGPRRQIQQGLVAQPSISSSGTESSRSIDQVAPCHQIVSLIENKAKKLCKNSAMEMIAHTENQLIRCYPSGFRVDSSNFNPLSLWTCGIQLAATNYQTMDAGQILNLSMFEQNGLCGYVLKPSVFWDKEHAQYGRFNPSSMEREGACFELTLTVISAQYLTQNSGSNTSVYIEVELLGIPIDCMSRKTKPSIKNSLNPIWQETFIFQVFFTDLVFVRFHVYDASSNHLVAQRVMPLKCLRPGYRHVRLRDIQNIPLELSTIFIYSKIIETILIRPPEQDHTVSNTPHMFRNRLLRRIEQETTTVSGRESIRPKHKTFEVKVYGKDGRDEEFRIFAVTQYTTVEELLELISKCTEFFKVGDTISDFTLIESSKTWKKKSKDTHQRVLGEHERILEVIDRVGRETIILCKRKSTVQKQSFATLIDQNIQNWENCDRTFLVTIYNISPLQKHTTFRTPVSSTAIHVITQLMTKTRSMPGLPQDYGLIEETDLNANAKLTTNNPTRRIPLKRRLLNDDEKIYGIQRLWNSGHSRFVLCKKTEYSAETNNNRPFTDKFLMRSLTRQKSMDCDSHEDLHLEHQHSTPTQSTLPNGAISSKISLKKRSIKNMLSVKS